MTFRYIATTALAVSCLFAAGCGGDERFPATNDSTTDAGTTGGELPEGVELEISERVGAGGTPEPYIRIATGHDMLQPLAMRETGDGDVVTVAAATSGADVDADIDDIVIIRTTAGDVLPDATFGAAGVALLSARPGVALEPQARAVAAIHDGGQILVGISQATAASLVFTASDGTADAAAGEDGIVRLEDGWAPVAAGAAGGRGWVVVVERAVGDGGGQTTADGTHPALADLDADQQVAALVVDAAGTISAATPIPGAAGRRWQVAGHESGAFTTLSWGGSESATAEVRHFRADGSAATNWGRGGALTVGLGGGRVAGRDIDALADGGVRLLLNHTAGESTRPYVAALDRRGVPIETFGRGGLAPAAESAPATDGQSIEPVGDAAGHLVVRYVARQGSGFGLVARRTVLDARGRPVPIGGSVAVDDTVTGNEWRWMPRRVLIDRARAELVAASDPQDDAATLLVIRRPLPRLP